MRKWEENVRRVIPYVPGEQPTGDRLIKLNTNECPYPPSPRVMDALQGIHAEGLRRYPDPEVGRLRRTLAEYYGVNPDQVFVGVGSDDVLANAFLTFFHSDKPILFPDITYSFYDVWAKLFDIPYEKVPLKEDFCMEASAYQRENGGIIFPNPNAPTGIFEELSTVRKILDANRDVVVIVDEAYVDFGGESALTLLKEYDNLLVVQTFSKSRAMAGARIGFAIGNEKLIRYLNEVKFSFNSYTMSEPAIAMGIACVEDEAYFQKIVGKVIATRERTKLGLQKLGFTFPDAKSNFIFARHECIPAKVIFEACRREQIYLRYFAKEKIDNYLRISIGTDTEMDRLLAFLESFVKKGE